jgi:methionyl-tRNA formyltransferase
MNNAPYIFFGTPDFSVIILEQLAQGGFLPKLIVTGPDKPKGRNLAMTPPPVKVWAQSHGIPVIQPTTLKDDALATALAEQKADVFIVAAYGKILPKKILDIPPKGVLNVHPSLLPHLRGSSPIESAILRDEKETGVSIMLLDEEMDHGPILAAEKLTIGEWPTAPELERTLGEKGGRLLASILPQWLAGTIKAAPQDHAQATFTKKIEKADGLIDLTADPYENFRKIKAYAGWPTAYFFTEKNGTKMRVIIKDAEFKNGNLVITRIVPEGKQEMNYSDFMRSA